jgi:hypothetical protein
MTAPEYQDLCWPVDVSCCEEWDSYSESAQDRALALATSTLRALTGYRVGGCPSTVRPCRSQCRGSQFGPYQSYYGSWFPGNWLPMINTSGQWINIGCGCYTDCSCTSVCEVTLPPPVGFIESVMLGDTEVAPENYRVDNGRRLVWQGEDDCGWPLCQDMAAPVGAPDTFAVTYLNAHPVDGVAAYAAGVLACEYAKSACGKKCRLPSGVTSVVRQGVAYQVNPGTFPGGVTGIPEIDGWLNQVNPYHAKFPPSIWYPGMDQGRVTTWTSGP